MDALSYDSPIANFVKKCVNYSVHFTGLVPALELKLMDRPRLFRLNETVDYVRICSLELVAHEIKSHSIPGCVAELGVYRGFFARYINMAFPERTLYLFDTFESFNPKDVEYDRNLGYASGKFSCKNTSIDLVLSKMPNPKVIKPIKGYFPDSAIGIEETFSFVSIDVDLFDPTYEGLKYFYPRLAHKGYIFVHDYNDSSKKGVKQAIMQFCNDMNITLVPIPDGGGSAIITK